jgi:hypothetical protein
MLKRRLKLLGKILLALFVILVVFLLLERFRGQIGLALYERELIRKGEKLEIGELIAPPIPESENRAADFFKFSGAMQTGDVLPLQPPPCMKFGDQCLRPLVGFRESTWQNPGKWEVTNSWEDVELELSTNRLVMQGLGELLESSAFDHKLAYTKGFEMLTPHLQAARKLHCWFVASAQLSLRRGNSPEAFHKLIAALRLPRILENDRLLASEAVRIRIANENFAVCWEALQPGNWTDGQLAQIQTAWEQTTFLTNIVQALRMERAILRSEVASFFSSPRSDPDVGLTIFHVTPGWIEIMPDWIEDPFKKWVVPSIWRFAWLQQDQKNLLETIDQLIQICEFATTSGSKPKVSALLDQFDNQYLPHECRATLFPLCESFLVSDFATTKKAFRAETQKSVVLSAIALKRYSLHHGKLPTSLETLVPEFLSAVPVDYMDGKPIKYRLNDDGSFTLYSVGEDGQDDGGELSLPPEVKTTRDLWRRRDYVWPAPATPEEVEAYRQGTGRD